MTVARAERARTPPVRPPSSPWFGPRAQHVQTCWQLRAPPPAPGRQLSHAHTQLTWPPRCQLASARSAARWCNPSLISSAQRQSATCPGACVTLTRPHPSCSRGHTQAAHAATPKLLTRPHPSCSRGHTHAAHPRSVGTACAGGHCSHGAEQIKQQRCHCRVAKSRPQREALEQRGQCSVHPEQELHVARRRAEGTTERVRHAARLFVAQTGCRESACTRRPERPTGRRRDEAISARARAGGPTSAQSASVAPRPEAHEDSDAVVAVSSALA
jgi:hypothetical protein